MCNANKDCDNWIPSCPWAGMTNDHERKCYKKIDNPQTEQAEASSLSDGLATQHGLDGVFRNIISHRTMGYDLGLEKDEFDELIDDLVKAAMMGC